MTPVTRTEFVQSGTICRRLKNISSIHNTKQSSTSKIRFLEFRLESIPIAESLFGNFSYSIMFPNFNLSQNNKRKLDDLASVYGRLSSIELSFKLRRQNKIDDATHKSLTESLKSDLYQFDLGMSGMSIDEIEDGLRHFNLIQKFSPATMSFVRTPPQSENQDPAAIAANAAAAAQAHAKAIAIAAAQIGGAVKDLLNVCNLDYRGFFAFSVPITNLQTAITACNFREDFVDKQRLLEEMDRLKKTKVAQDSLTDDENALLQMLVSAFGNGFTAYL